MALDFEINVKTKGAKDASSQIDKIGESADNAAKDINKATEALENAEEAASNLGKEAEKVADTIEEAGKAAEETSDKISDFGKNTNTDSLRMQLRRTTEELQALTLEYNSMSDAEKKSARGRELIAKIDNLREEAATLRDTMDDVNQSIRNAASDTSNWDALGQSVNLASSAVGALTGGMQMLGVAEEDVQNIQAQLQASLAISNALTVAQNALQGQSALMLGVRKVQEAAAATAITIRAAAEGKGVIATKAATVAQAAFNVVAKANPYVLLATALVTVVGALWAFSKGMNEASKLEKQQEEETQKQIELNKKFEESISTSASTAIAKYRLLSDEYKKLTDNHKRTEWIEKNKSAFSELGLSVNNVVDAEKIFVDDTDNVVTAFKLRAEAAAYSQKLQDAYKRKIERQTQNEKIRQFTTPKSGSTVTNTKGLTKGTDYYFDYDKQQNVYTGSGAAKAAENIRKSMQDSSDEVLKAIDEEIEQYADKYGSLVDKANSLIPEATANNTTATAKKATDNTKKEIESAAKDYAKAVADLQKDAAQAEVDAQKEGADKSLAQIKLDYENRKNEIAKRQKELIEQKKAAGQGDTLNQQEAGYFSSLTKANEAAYAQSLQSLKSVNEQAHREYLEQYGTYEEKRLAISQKYDAEITAAEGNEWKKRTLEMQKQIALQQASFNEFKSNPKFALAFDSPDNASIETLKTLIEEFTRRANEGQLQGLNLEELKVWFDAANQMYDNLAERDPFTALKESSKQLADAQNRLTTAQNKLNKAKADTTKNIKLQVDANGKLVKVEQDLSKLEAEVARAENDVQNAQQKQQKATKAATEYVNQYAAAFRDLGQIIGGTEGKALECIAQTMEFTTSTIDNIQKIANTVASQISATMKALETGLVILAIISAAMKLIQAISELVKSEHELYEEYAKKQTAINDLITSVNDYKIAVAEAAKAEKTWFASSNGSNLREQWKVSENALEAYNKKYNETQAKYVNESGGGWLTKGWGAITSAVNWVSGLASQGITKVLDGIGVADYDSKFSQVFRNMSKGTDPLTNGINMALDASVEKAEDFSGTMVKAFQNLRIETQAATKGFWGTGIGAKSQKTEDLTTWVKENYGEDLFRKDGMINSTLVTQIIEEQGDKLVGETKKTLEKLQEYTDKYDEFKEQLKESVSQLYSPLADDLTDALWEWYKEGTDVMDKFHEYAADTFESIAKDAIKSAVLTKLFDGYKDKIADLYEQYSYSNIDETQLMNAVAAETTALTGQVEAALPTLQAMTKSVGDAIAAAGYASDSSSQISASQRSVASMSEDTASELNGRFTALQISGNSIDTNLKLLALELKNDAKETHGYLKKIVSEAEDISDNSQAEQNIKVNVDAPVVNVNVEPNVNVDAPQVNVNVEPVVNIDAPQVNVTADNSEINSIIQSVNSALMSLTASNGTNVAILNSINGTMESAVSAIMSVQMSIGDSNGMLANINASVLACNGTLNAIYNTNDSGFRTLQQEIRAVASAINNKL